MAIAIVTALSSFLLPSFGQPDPAPSVKIRFENKTNRFQVGEVIPIELSFTGPVSKGYKISMRTYSRSGRLGLEVLHVSPPGRDPLYNYYKSGFGFIGGGIGGEQVLDNKPVIIRVELNEWVALDAPGSHTLYITSSRVGRRSDASFEPIALRSNTLELEIVEADGDWQERVLGSTVDKLDNPNSTQGARQAAIRTLRFLDTPGSIRELVGRLVQSGDINRWDFRAGLMGSRRQDLVLQELDKQFRAPKTAITADYLSVLALSRFLKQHGPLLPRPEGDPVAQEIWGKRAAARIKQFNRLQDALYEEAAELVTAKRGKAQAETVYTLLIRGPRTGDEVKPLDTLPESELASSFLELSSEQQAGLLQHYWMRVRVPAMVGPLEAIVDKPQIDHSLLRDLALQRLFELSPTRAIPRILTEIREQHLDNGASTVSAKTLGLLPNGTLPEFDALLIARLEEKDSRTLFLDARLIGRYASKDILPRVKTFYERSAGRWACDIEDGLITYFLRFDPGYGLSRLLRVNADCVRESLKEVSETSRWADVEAALIKRLYDTNPLTAQQAAKALGRYGGPRAEKALWERLRSFHRENRLSEREARPKPHDPSGLNAPFVLQYGLVQALAKAQGWLLDNHQITELENLVSASMRENVALWHWHSPVNLNIRMVLDGRLHLDINRQYFATEAEPLLEKLAQYPEGTRFSLNVFGPQNQLARVIQTIRRTALGHGLIIESSLWE